MTPSSDKNNPRPSWRSLALGKGRRVLATLVQWFSSPIARRMKQRQPGFDHEAGRERQHLDAMPPEYEFSSEQRALWKDVAGSLSNLGWDGRTDAAARAESVFFHNAQPNHYIRLYRFKAWQHLWCPIHCARFSRRKRLLKEISGDTMRSRVLIRLIDEDLAFIEFGGKPLSPQQRFLARREILRKGVSPWKVRAAFISMYVARRGNRVAVQPVPAGIYWPGRIGREVFFAVAALSIGTAGWDASAHQCLTCNALGLTYLSVFLLLLAYLSHIAGPERRSAERLLVKMKLLNLEHV